MKKISVFIFIFFIISNCIYGQKYANKDRYLIDSLELNLLSENHLKMVDSCINEYHKAKSDSAKIIAISYIVEECWNDKVWPKYNLWLHHFLKEKLNASISPNEMLFFKKEYGVTINNIGFWYQEQSNYPKSMEYMLIGLEIDKDLRDSAGLATTYNNIGYLYSQMGQIEKSLDYYKYSLKIREKIKDINGLAGSLINLGQIYKEQGNVLLGLEYFHKGLKLYEKAKNKRGLAYCYNNIGYLHKELGEYNLALENFNKSLKLREEITDRAGISEAYNNIGLTYSQLKKYDLALEFYNKSIAIRLDLGDRDGLSTCYINVGTIYRKNNNIPLALEYFTKSLNLQKEINSKENMAHAYNGLGYLYFRNYEGINISKNKGLEKAIEMGEEGLKLGKELGYPNLIKINASLLYKVYNNKKDFERALDMRNLEIEMRDSLFNEENTKSITRQLTKFEYDKQKAIDDVENEKKVAIEKEKQKRQFIILIIVIIASALILILALIIYRRLKITRKQKLIIEEQKEEVETQRDQIEKQKEKVEEAHKEIKDSINYAKRIQNAILPSSNTINELLPNSLILYKPKDVVAGDFYWIEQVGNIVLFAAADCTGHGVPGAMVSVVCHNALNRAVREFGLIEPGLILDKTREIVIAEFEKSEDDVKDGMDIALCSINGNTLKYAGANNPLWIVRNGEILETKANKQPIGKFENVKPFTTHTIELEQRDLIYIFSDGFADQFGGEEGKKYGTKRFKSFILSIQEKSIEEQKELLNSEFNFWKEKEEQLDDVCVIGLKI